MVIKALHLIMLFMITQFNTITKVLPLAYYLTSLQNRRLNKQFIIQKQYQISQFHNEVA